MTDRNTDMRHILSQVRLHTGGTVMEDVEQLIQAVSNELGVTMELFDMAKSIVLADMQRDEGPPGSGKLALQRLCAYADSVNKPIELSVLDDEPKLVKLYAAFGFSVIEATDEYEGGIHMVRAPKVHVMETTRSPKMTKKSALQGLPALLPATPENIERAKAFALKKWIERFNERTIPGSVKVAPADLSSACKFTSMFAQAVFGGRLRGNEGHQYVQLNDGTTLDLNMDASDVQRMIRVFAKDGRTGWFNDDENPGSGDTYHGDPHHHDAKWFGNPDHIESMRSIVPRVNDWVKEFLG